MVVLIMYKAIEYRISPAFAYAKQITTCCWVACSRINLREKEMFTTTQKYVKSRVRVRAAACVPLQVPGNHLRWQRSAAGYRAGSDKVMNMQAKAEFYSEVLTIVLTVKKSKLKLRTYSVTRTNEAAAHRLRSRLIAE